jgi:hypothetical protein
MTMMTEQNYTNLTMHLLANVGDVREDGLFVSFSVNGGWSNEVTFLGRVGEERGIRSV